MDYFNDVLTTLLGLECGGSLAMQGQKALDIKKIEFVFRKWKNVIRIWNDTRVSN